MSDQGRDLPTQMGRIGRRRLDRVPPPPSQEIPTGLQADQALEELRVNAEPPRAAAADIRGGAGSSASSGSSTLVPETPPPGQPETTETQPGPSTRKPALTFPATFISKQGSSGVRTPLITNYFPMETYAQGNWTLYEHFVEFDPNDDRTFYRKSVLRTVRAGLGAFIFDGRTLFTANPHGTREEPLVLTVTSRDDGSDTQITIQLLGAVDPNQPIYNVFHNLVLRKTLYGMGLEEIGRNFYDPRAEIGLPRHGLALWPGFVTSIRPHEGGTLLCVEVTHKVLRGETVLTLMSKMENSPNYKKSIEELLFGATVITKYNRLNYRIEDIDWGLNPRSLFKRNTSGGEEYITYADYVQEKYKYEIKDLTQPLVLTRPTRKDLQRGENQPVYLVPETCLMTGLTDAMRSNFTLMRDLGHHLHMEPAHRVEAINEFMGRVQGAERVTRELREWSVGFNPELVHLTGRVLPKEGIFFNNAPNTKPRPEVPDEMADWTMAFRNRTLLSTKALMRWVILVPQAYAQHMDNFFKLMFRVSSHLNFTLFPPVCVIELEDNNVPTYMRSIDQVLKLKVQLVFVVLPYNKTELYSNVKERLTGDFGVPSQCFLAKNLTSKGLMSIATKLVVQMSAKIGGEPWTVQVPLKGLMVVGLDVFKGPGAKYFGALVASTTQTLGSYFSSTCQHTNLDDLSFSFTGSLVAACKAYKKTNGKLPTKILIYRDSISEGQLLYALGELKKLKDALDVSYAPADPPRLTYIVVTKRVNTRFFTEGPYAENPPPGTVVDDVVTLPNRYDFFLISTAPRQGTVSPCSYHILEDTQNLGPDKLQRLTFKLCHMYYNWSGTVAVPAPLQYAHKLVGFVGNSIKKKPNDSLNHLLHFL